MPFAKRDAEPVYLSQMKALLGRHPDTTIVWAHTGLGRVVHPVGVVGSGRRGRTAPEPSGHHRGAAERSGASATCTSTSPGTKSPNTSSRLRRSSRATASLINRYPDRFLFGTDNVAPVTPEAHFAVFEQYAPLWKALTPEASQKVRLGNYARLFDAARTRVRAWEKSHVQ